MLRRFIIRVNNFIVRKRNRRVEPDNLLLLLPHCLQRKGCEHNLINDINKCESCGRCDIAELLKLRDELHVRCHFVGGGREAVCLVKSPDIHGVVACACEKELVDGICASFPKSVLAVCNNRPNGPCRDTKVDVAEVRSAILEMINSKFVINS